MSKITSDGLTQSGNAFQLYPYGNSGCQRVKCSDVWARLALYGKSREKIVEGSNPSGCVNERMKRYGHSVAVI